MISGFAHTAQKDLIICDLSVSNVACRRNNRQDKKKHPAPRILLTKFLFLL